ncbi:MAG TPA: hypothetical protein VMH61_07865 [Candidatus Acidoferrales bacterium]|nr:hypothetical protein [Candidatus Acidoferrales bacterium]
MKRFVLLVVIVGVAWYGWKHYRDLKSAPQDVAVIENHASNSLQRVRLIAGGGTYVRDEIASGASATIPFPVAGDGELRLVWQVQGRQGEFNWAGGQVTSGPLRSRHHLDVSDDGGVVWSSERIASATGQ